MRIGHGTILRLRGCSRIVEATESFRRRTETRDWERAERMLGFGGIRIEQNLLVTGGDPDVLTADIPLLAG